MNAEELIKICRDRNEIEFLYQICKLVAESDSIGESYLYTPKYSRESFNNAEKFIEANEYKSRGFKDYYCPYLEECGIKIYELYLEHIKYRVS